MNIENIKRDEHVYDYAMVIAQRGNSVVENSWLPISD